MKSNETITPLQEGNVSTRQFVDAVEFGNTSNLSSAIELTANTVGSLVAGGYSLIFYSKPKQSISQRLKECIELMEIQDNDIRLIYIALNASRQDIRAATIETRRLLTSFQFSFMLKKKQESYNRHLVQRINMLNELTELLNTYPKLEPEDLRSLEKLNIFYNDRDAHHQQVLALVEIYLPETYMALNEARLIQQSLS